MSAKTIDNAVWSSAGLSAAWQVLSDSDAAFTPLGHTYNTTAEVPLQLIEIPVAIEVPAPGQPGLTISAPHGSEELRQGLLHLLRFRLEPDEPTDQDLRTEPDLPFPD